MRSKKNTTMLVVNNNNDKKISTEFTEICKAFPEYQKIDFMEKMRNRFDSVFQAFVNARYEELKALLSSELYESFSEQISKRESSNLRQEILIKHIETIITKVMPSAKNLILNMKFNVSQMSALINSEGVSYNNPGKIFLDVSHFWVFQRKISKDSDWILIQTSIKN
ncbi:MAG: TIM44-like domain-containing protein [Holosporales bacterium]|jgi:predicted lipid-binding transport protein (Tim44 family)|nr:TIM44-like domain-containing protein [Holosporales bacterium]